MFHSHGFFAVIFSRDCLRTVIFIIAVVFEAESDGAGKREACSNARCGRMSRLHSIAVVTANDFRG